MFFAGLTASGSSIAFSVPWTPVLIHSKHLQFLQLVFTSEEMAFMSGCIYVIAGAITMAFAEGEICYSIVVN